MSRRKSKRSASKVFDKKEVTITKEWKSTRPKPYVDHFIWGEENAEEIALYVDWHGRHPHCLSPRSRSENVHGHLIEDEDNPNLVYSKTDLGFLADRDQQIPFEYRPKLIGFNGHLAEVSKIAMEQERREHIINAHHQGIRFYQTSVKDNLDLYHIDGTYTIQKHVPKLRKLDEINRNNNGLEGNKLDDLDLYERIFSKENIEIINKISLDPSNWKTQNKQVKRGVYQSDHEWTKFTKQGTALDEYKDHKLECQLESAMKKFNNQGNGEFEDIPEEIVEVQPSLISQFINTLNRQLQNFTHRLRAHLPNPTPPITTQIPKNNNDQDLKKMQTEESSVQKVTLPTIPIFEKSAPKAVNAPHPTPSHPKKFFGFTFPLFSDSRVHPNSSISSDLGGLESTVLEGSSWITGSLTSSNHQTHTLDTESLTTFQTIQGSSHSLNLGQTDEIKSAWMITPPIAGQSIDQVQEFSLASQSDKASTSQQPNSSQLSSHRKGSTSSDGSDVTESTGHTQHSKEKELISQKLLLIPPQLRTFKPALKARDERYPEPFKLPKMVDEIRDIDGGKWSSDPSRAMLHRIGGQKVTRKIAKNFEAYATEVRARSVGLTTSKLKGFTMSFDLIDACSQGNYMTVLGLLMSGENPNQTVADDNLFLYIFKLANKLDIEICSLIVGAPESTERKNLTKILDMLVKYNADVNFISPKDGFGAIHVAALRGNAKLITWLLDQGNGNKNLRSLYGENLALHCSAKYGHVNVLTVLLKRGCNINLVDGAGWTALHHAAEQGQTKVALFLLDIGAKKRIKNNDGKTAAQLADDLGYHITSQSILQHCIMPDQAGPLLSYMTQKFEPSKTEADFLSTLPTSMFSLGSLTEALFQGNQGEAENLGKERHDSLVDKGIDGILQLIGVGGDDQESVHSFTSKNNPN